jgi:hypothetical protein
MRKDIQATDRVQEAHEETCWIGKEVSLSALRIQVRRQV